MLILEEPIFFIVLSLYHNYFVKKFTKLDNSCEIVKVNTSLKIITTVVVSNLDLQPYKIMAG